MHYSTLAAMAVLAAPFAGAQSLNSLPTCAQGPAEAGITSTGCALTDFKCICSAQAFVASLTTRIQQACSQSDQAATIAFAQQLCGSVGVTIASPSMASSMASSMAASSMAASSMSSMPMSMSSSSMTAMTTTVAPIVTQLTDGQPGAATSAAVVTQIGDGQIQAPTSASPLKTANATTVSTPSPSAFVGAAAGLSAQSAAVVLAGAVAAVFAL